MNVSKSKSSASPVSGASDRLCVTTLGELDALVGKFVTGDAPKVYWEDTSTQWRFDTLAEALEAMRDPYFAAFAPDQERSRSSLKEVQDYPGYSQELEAAMAVVQQLSSEAKPLTLFYNASRQWAASFPGTRSTEAGTAALAICLAALRTRGLEVTVALEGAVGLDSLPYPRTLAGPSLVAL